jgi:hypothetical protein
MTSDTIPPDAIPYVQSAASQEVPPPYHFPRVTVNAFVWEANLPQVQAYCDRFFNLGDARDREFTYQPAAIWPYALLLIIDYPVMLSASPVPENIGSEVPYANRGIVSQKEVFVALPVVRYGTAPGRLVANANLEWALPFIVVGEPMSAVCGREMLGLEKMRAEITVGESTFPDSFRGRVSLPGWATDKVDEMQRMLPFLDVDTGPAVPTWRGSAKETSLWTLLRSRTAGSAIGALATASEFLDTVSAGAIPTAMQTVSLKQFRDAEDPGKALYQALISCRSKYTSIENFEFYNENDVEITFHADGSLSEIIPFVDLPPGKPRIEGKPQAFRPKAAYRFNATIDFDNMRTLHTFAVDRGPGLPPSKATSDLISPWLRPWQGFFGKRRP